LELGKKDMTEILFDFEGEWYGVSGQGIWPVDWHPYGDPARTCEGGFPHKDDPHLAHLVKTGVRSLGYEKVWDTHRGGGQTVVETQPGDEIVFSIFGRYIYQADEGVDIGLIHMRIGIDPEGGVDPDAQSVVWSAEQEIAVNGFDGPIEWHHFGVSAIAESTRAMLFLFTNPTEAGARHSGPVWDDGRVTITTPEPPPNGCFGLPREDYTRTVNVVVDKAAARKVWDIPLPQRQAYEDFYTEWYPRVKVSFADTGGAKWEPYLLWQLNPWWSEHRFGPGGCTIGRQGCYITNLAMAQLIYAIDDKATPVTIDEALTISGYSQPCLPLWSAIAEKCRLIISRPSKEELDAHIVAGGVGMIEVQPTSLEHWVLAVEVLADNDYLVLDPLRNRVERLSDHYEGAQSFRKIVKKVIPDTGPHLEYIAPHMQTRDSDKAVAVFLRQKHPRGWKGFSAQDCLWAYLIAQEGGWPLWIDYRKHFSTQDLSSSPETIAHYICNAYAGDINKYGHAIDSIEGFNEIIDSSVEGVKRAVAIELAFMKEVDRRGWPVRACVHNTGVGNPHESQVYLMLPMAEYAAEHGHIKGLHSYGGADRNQSYLVSDAPYHAMRYAEQDRVFVDHGFKVRWFLSEAGPIRAGPRQPSGYLPMPDPEAGWRHSTCMNGDWSRAFEFWSTYTAMLHAWNLENEDRVIAASAFTTCSEAEDWDDWRYQSPEWLYLASH
jgi:hypothetical protein